MSKKSKRTPAVAPSWFDKFTDPAAIFEQIEQASTGTEDSDRYRNRVNELMAAEIDRCSDPDTQQDLQAIRSLFHVDAFEEISRKTGFILGFEYCRELLTREATKGGAR